MSIFVVLIYGLNNSTLGLTIFLISFKISPPGNALLTSYVDKNLNKWYVNNWVFIFHNKLVFNISTTANLTLYFTNVFKYEIFKATCSFEKDPSANNDHDLSSVLIVSVNWLSTKSIFAIFLYEILSFVVEIILFNCTVYSLICFIWLFK